MNVKDSERGITQLAIFLCKKLERINFIVFGIACIKGTSTEGKNMRRWVQTVIQTMKVFILFTGCTLLFYYGILWISKEYESYHRYEEPDGKAVKVFYMEGNESSPSWLERLMLFYREAE